MNKKASGGTIVAMIILLIVTFILMAMFFFPDKLLPTIKKMTIGFERFLLARPKTEIPPGLGAPKEITEIFDNLYSSFINSRGKTYCLIEHKSLNIGEFSIELEYLNRDNQLSMLLRNQKDQIVDSHVVNNVKPCIVLPIRRDTISKVVLLEKAEIKNNNKLYYGGHDYQLFSKYPLLYKPKKEEYLPTKPENIEGACFFTDSTVTNPTDPSKTYTFFTLRDGFGFGDRQMAQFKSNIPKCS